MCPLSFARVESRFTHVRTFMTVRELRPSTRSIRKYMSNFEVVDAAKQLLPVHSHLARRNALAPIFLSTPRDSPLGLLLSCVRGPGLFHCFREHNPGWIRARHVCQFWRRVALDASVWATISGISANSELISAMIRPVPTDLKSYRRPR